MPDYYVYILSSLSRALYVGMTRDLRRRLYEHRNRVKPGFATHYHIDRLVYFEHTTNVAAAIAREKQIKAYSRNKKVELIESMNLGWVDLAEEMRLVEEPPQAGLGVRLPATRRGE